MTRTLRGADEMRALGRRLGATAEPGSVVSLAGDLGAGKTVLAKGIGEGLSVPTRIQSPTFILVQAHANGRLPYWHADLYRVGSADELDAIGFSEFFEGGGVVAVEWGDRFPEALPADRLEIRIAEDADPDVRFVDLNATGPRHAAWLARVEAARG